MLQKASKSTSGELLPLFWTGLIHSHKKLKFYKVVFSFNIGRGV